MNNQQGAKISHDPLPVDHDYRVSRHAELVSAGLNLRAVDSTDMDVQKGQHQHRVKVTDGDVGYSGIHQRSGCQRHRLNSQSVCSR